MKEEKAGRRVEALFRKLGCVGAIKPIKAIAVVDRKRPVLRYGALFDWRDRNGVICDMAEEAIEVLITPVTAPKSVKSAPGRVKRGKR